jgi:hypothetical protein
VQIAVDFARTVSARLAGVDVPKYEDNEETFADLQLLLSKTLDFVKASRQNKSMAAESAKSLRVLARQKRRDSLASLTC